MIIIVISHGITCNEPFTKTYHVRPQDMPISSVSKILEFLEQRNDIEICHIDEMLVIFDDRLQAHYSSDQINEVFDEITEEELEDLDNVA